MEHGLSEKWIKASIAGTIWAASEIVLGSFLHNLRVPFSGNILTAIGIIILISINYLWSDRGLFWRAGIICALMKTLSPSAIIFGPMIAIFFESVIMEFSVRILGRSFAGYLIGAMGAMSWNLFQKIANYIIYYGSNIIEVYNNLLTFAQKQINTDTDIVWLPLIVLLVIFALFGLMAGVMGIIIGRNLLRKEQMLITNSKKIRTQNMQKPEAEIRFNYSVIWLFADIILIIVSFFLLSKTTWIIWSIAIVLIITIWSFRYRRALRQLSKPKFWILFVIITLIAAFAFAGIEGSKNSLEKGIMIGIQMNFRAAIMVTGFAVLGTELYNPVVRDFFRKTSARNLPLALELSVESLPAFIANIPDYKSLLKNPVSIFHSVLSQAEIRLSEIKNKVISGRRFIISGGLDQGKTAYVKDLIDFLRKKKIKIGGIISEKLVEEKITIGYDIIDIEAGEKQNFLRQDINCGSDKIGRFVICNDGLDMGNKILASLCYHDTDLIIIDEVGKLEINGKGWAGSIDKIISGSRRNILMVVRDNYTDAIINKWDFKGTIIFNIAETGFQEAGERILSEIT